MDTLEVVQAEHLVWSEHNFGTKPGDDVANPFIGAVEEMGELAHALLKKRQGIRGTPEEHDAAAKDAIGDVMIYLIHLCNLNGWSMRDILEETWQEVGSRDWRSFPKNGRTE